MTILIIPRKQFEKDVGKLNEKMQEQIAMFGTPIEALTDDELQIEIFPNRPDLLSYQNYKHAFLAFLGKNTGLKKIEINKPEKDYKVIIDKSIEKVRPYTACAIVKNLNFNDEKIKEIIDIQEKLHITLGRKRKKGAIGIYPLEKIKLPITFKALAPEEIKFQPLEFPRVINGRQILSQHPAGREYGFLLDSYEKYPVFVDADNEILSMPPIINSHKTGKINCETKDIFIECSGFDLEVLKKILNIIVLSLDSMGGQVYQMNLQYGSKIITTPDFEPEKIKLSLEHANKLLGLELNEKRAKEFLERMGYDYVGGNALAPAWRADILHEVDLIEDIAIAYGYDKFIPEIPKVATIGEISKTEMIKSKISEILVGLNLLETSSYHLTTKEAQIKNMLSQDKEFIELLNSKTEYNILRKDLAHYALKIFSENIDVEYPQEIFQIGRVFHGLEERNNLVVALAPGNFTKLKQILEYLFRMLNLEFKIEHPKLIPAHFIEGRLGEVKFNNSTIGYLGEVHPRVLKNFKIKMPVALFEIELEDVLKTLS